MSLFTDEIEWEDPPKRVGGPGRTGYVSGFVEAVKARPEQWAVLKRGAKNPSSIEKSRYPGMEWTSRRMDDGSFTIYGRWVGDTTSAA